MVNATELCVKEKDKELESCIEEGYEENVMYLKQSFYNGSLSDYCG